MYQLCTRRWPKNPPIPVSSGLTQELFVLLHSRRKLHGSARRGLRPISTLGLFLTYFMSCIHLWSVVFYNLFPSYIPRIHFSLYAPNLPLVVLNLDPFSCLLSFQALACLFVGSCYQLSIWTFPVVISNDENEHRSGRLSDLASASRADMNGSVDAQPPAAKSLQSGERHRLWLDLPEDDRRRLWKLFSEDNICRSTVVIDLRVAIYPSSNAGGCAIFHDGISLHRISPPRADTSFDVIIVFVASSYVRRLSLPQSSAHEGLDRVLPPVAGGYVVSSRAYGSQAWRSTSFW